MLCTDVLLLLSHGGNSLHHTSDLVLEVNRLKAVREAMNRKKKRLSAQLRNTDRKRSRLRSRAKALSTNDLLEVDATRVRANAANDGHPRGPV